MTLLILFLCILSLILLITWGKVNTFLAFLIVSTAAALLLGMPMNKVATSVTHGLGDTLGSLVIVIVLGAMLGKLVAVSGAAQKIASVLKSIFGYKYVTWAMCLTGFIVGIPMFYNVAFVLLIPIIFSVATQYKLPPAYVGLPMMAALSVMHGFIPPHPSPMALVLQFHADLAHTFFYGILIAIPAIIIAGPLFATTLKNLHSPAILTLSATQQDESNLPGIFNSIASSLLPVIIIASTMLISKFAGQHSALKNIADFFGDTNIAMITTIVIATFSLGVFMGKKLSQVMAIYTDAVKEIAMILLIIGSAGVLKQVFIDSGVNNQLAALLQTLPLPPLILAWIITAILRLCLGSATVAGLTAAGIVYPLMVHAHVNPSLMVLSVGAGSLFCSHVNDTSFWMFKEYLGLSMKQTFFSWSLMETLVSVIGLAGVLVVNMVI